MAELEAVQEDKMMTVYIGRRQVGEIPERVWLHIVDNVRQNRIIWEAQVKNMFRVIGRVFGFTFICIPLGMFWSAVILAWLGKPIPFGGHVGAIVEQPQVVLAGTLMAVTAMLALGIKPGYVNYFAKAQSALLKAHLDIEEPGDCTVR